MKRLALPRSNLLASSNTDYNFALQVKQYMMALESS